MLRYVSKTNNWKAKVLIWHKLAESDIVAVKTLVTRSIRILCLSAIIVCAAVLDHLNREWEKTAVGPTLESALAMEDVSQQEIMLASTGLPPEMLAMVNHAAQGEAFISGKITDQAGVPADSIRATYSNGNGVLGMDISDEKGDYSIVFKVDDPQLGRNLATFPNPAPSDGTNVAYKLDRTTDVKLAIYDALGRQTKLLENSGQKAPGQYMVRWDATNDAGERVASGIYFCRLETQGGQYVLKMTLMKSSGGIGGATSVNLDTFPIDGTLSFEDLHAGKKYENAQFQLTLNGEETVDADYELNRIPSLDNLAEHYAMQEGGSLIINPMIVDDTGGTIDVKVEGSVDGAYTVTKSDSGYKITANGDYFTTAAFDRIILTVTDDDGATSAPRTIPLVTHNVNDPPMTNGDIPNLVYDIAQGDTMLYNIAPFFTDVDTDVLSYQVIGGDGSISIEDGMLKIPKMDPGDSLEIAVQASDGEYAVASNTFRIDMPTVADQTPWFTQLEVPDYVGDSLKVAWETALADQGQNPNYVDLKVGEMQVASNLPAAGYGSWDATQIAEGTNLVIGLVKKGELDSVGVSNSFIVDHTKPHVESIDGFLSGDPNNPFMIQFNQYNADGVTPEALDDLSIRITDLSTGAEADATYTVNYETNQVQVTPSGLENGKSYRLEVSSSDKAGNSGEAFVFDASTGFVWKDVVINFDEGGMQEITLADVIASGDYSGMTLHATSQDTTKLYTQNLPTSVIIGARDDRFNTSEQNSVNVWLKIINDQGITVDSKLTTPTVNMMTDLEGNVYVADHENLQLVPVPGAKVFSPDSVQYVADENGYYHIKVSPQEKGLFWINHPDGESVAYNRPEWVKMDKDRVIPFALIQKNVDIDYMENGFNNKSLRPLAMIDTSHEHITTQGDSILVPFYFDHQDTLSARFGEIAGEVLQQDLQTMYPGIIGYFVDDSTKAFGIIKPKLSGSGGSIHRVFDSSHTLIQYIEPTFNVNVDHIDEIRKNILLIEIGKGFTSGGDYRTDPNQSRLWEIPKRGIVERYSADDKNIGRTISLLVPLYGNDGYFGRFDQRWGAGANLERPRGTF